MARPRRVLALLALALVASSAPGAAQVPCEVQTAVDPGRLDHRPLEALRYNFSVSIPQGGLGGDVTVAVEGATPGWTATVAPTSFADVAAGGTVTAEVLVVAPGAEGTRQAQVTVRATLACQATPPILPLPGNPPGTATESQVLAPALVVPVGVPAPGGAGGLGDGSALLLVAGAVVLVALAGAGAVALRPRGLVLRAPEPRREMAPGGGASFAVHVENRSAEPVEAAVRILGLPEGWKVVSPPSQASVRPHGAATVQVLLRSPPGARPGDTAEFQVEFQERGSGRRRQVDLVATIEGAERPDVVVRDERTLDRR